MLVKPFIIGGLCLCICFISAAQGLPESPSFPEYSLSSGAFSKWVLSPSAFPYRPVINQQLDFNDEEIETEYDRGLILGLRLEKYYPNAAKGFGFEMDVLNRDLVLFRDSRYFLSETAVALTPIYKLKTGNFEKLRHAFFEFGVRNQYTFSQQLLQADGFFQRSPETTRVFKFWGYIGLGVLNDMFNQDAKRANLSSLSIGAYFNLFNQAPVFKNQASVFSAQEALFSNNKTSNAFISIKYAQYLDIKKNECTTCHQMPESLLGKNSHSKFLPPLIHWNNPRSFLFGNFYFNAGVQPRVDSTFIELESSSPVELNLLHGISTHLGYSFHFLGNHAKYYSATGEGLINQHLKGFRYDLFVSGGLFDSRTVLGKNTRYRIHEFGAEFSAGFRVGYSPPGIYLLGGYTRRLLLEIEVLYDNETFKDFNLGNIENEYFFLGLSYKNAIVLRANYRPLSTVKLQERFLDRLWFSIGFGI